MFEMVPPDLKSQLMKICLFPIDIRNAIMVGRDQGPREDYPILQLRKIPGVSGVRTVSIVRLDQPISPMDLYAIGFWTDDGPFAVTSPLPPLSQRRVVGSAAESGAPDRRWTEAQFKECVHALLQVP